MITGKRADLLPWSFPDHSLVIGGKAVFGRDPASFPVYRPRPYRGEKSKVISQPPLPEHRLVALPFTLMLLMWRPSPWPNSRSSVFAVFCHWSNRILGESLTCTPLLAETDAMVTHLAL